RKALGASLLKESPIMVPRKSPRFVVIDLLEKFLLRDIAFEILIDRLLIPLIDEFHGKHEVFASAKERSDKPFEISPTLIKSVKVSEVDDSRSFNTAKKFLKLDEFERSV